jgi:hypothetical protein
MNPIGGETTANAGGSDVSIEAACKEYDVYLQVLA